MRAVCMSWSRSRWRRRNASAATELALLHAKAERGVVTGEAFRRRQHDLLQLMHIARLSFARRHAQPPRAPWATAHGSGFAPGRHFS